MKRVLFGVLGACVIGLPAFATGIALPSMKTLDTDMDGKIQISEMEVWAKTEVHRYDADGNGEVTAAELRAADLGIPDPEVRRFMGFLDRDENGSLSEREAMAFFTMGFVQFDTNGDTMVDADEWSRAVQMLVAGAPR